MPEETPNPTPKKRRIALRSIEDARRELARVYRDMRAGRIHTADGSKLAYVLSLHADLVERGQLEARLTELEERERTRR